MKTKKPEKKFAVPLRGCSRWVVAAVAAAASAHFANHPVYGGVNWNDALLVDSAPRGGLSMTQIAKLPTWSLKRVAEAAAKRSRSRVESIRYKNLMTEFERRKAKAAGPARKEAV